MAWFRWYEEATSDPKFMVVSRRTGHPVAFVVAVWAMLLERANAASERGWITGFDCESADVLLGMPDGVAESILEALRAKGLLDGPDGDHVARWEERQPVRERSEEPSSTKRVREFRERQRELQGEMERSETPCSGAETPCNATKHHETPRREEIRREKEERENTASAPPAAMPSALPAAEYSLAVSPSGGEGALPPAQPTEPSELVPPLPVSRPRGKGKNAEPTVPEGEPHYRAKSGRYLTGKRLTSFERFWAAFAFAKGKAEAADAWLDIPQLTDVLVDEICRAAELEARQRIEDTAKGKSPKWGQGWLTARRWEDYAISAGVGTGVSPGVACTPVAECAPTPEELEANRQRGLRHAQHMRERGILPGGPVHNVPKRCDFGAAMAPAIGGQA